MNIRPVSDLRNKYLEIEKMVLKEDEAVYLTKNGYGSMVVMSLKKYTELIDETKYNEYIENSLDESEKEAENPNIKKLSYDETFSKLEEKLNG